jgi:peptidoglycan hydrolase CwlO-like protein
VSTLATSASTLLAALFTFGGGWLVYRQATRATRASADAETHRADAQAYQTAKNFYDDIIRRSAEQYQTAQTQVDHLAQQVLGLQRQLNEQQEQLNKRMNTEVELRARIAALEGFITSTGGVVPPWRS